jgi:hypothetical protein
LAHLGSIADGYLGGLVLSGCVDRLNLARQRKLLGLAASRLAPGAPLILIASVPESWAATAPALEVDLAPGRPLHAPTWVHLMSRVGLVDAVVSEGDGAVAVTVRRPG